MTDGHYWVRIREGAATLGAGFLLTPVYVLTAMHCLRPMSSKDAPLELELPDGRVLKGWLCDAASDVDLALVSVEGAREHRLPLALTDWPRTQARWRGSYCPPGAYMQLSGVITHASMPYGSAEGGEFTGIQLIAEQDVGDFSGYSGSPVDTDPAEGTDERPVVGILMEQLKHHERLDEGSNVLIAASVRYAMDLFPHFNIDFLRNAGQALPPQEGTRRGARRHAEDVKDVLTALREWEDAGLITPEEAHEQRRRSLRQFGDSTPGGDPDEN